MTQRNRVTVQKRATCRPRQRMLFKQNHAHKLDSYRQSFFPRTLQDWDALPHHWAAHYSAVQGSHPCLNHRSWFFTCMNCICMSTLHKCPPNEKPHIILVKLLKRLSTSTSKDLHVCRMYHTMYYIYKRINFRQTTTIWMQPMHAIDLHTTWYKHKTQ